MGRDEVTYDGVQTMVRSFMIQASQRIRYSPGVPTEEERIRLSRVFLEEAFELVHKGLGVDCIPTCCLKFNECGSLCCGPLSDCRIIEAKKDLQFSIATDRQPDLLEIADGNADGHYTLTCIACACGLYEDDFIYAVAENNLAKFSEGHSWDESGKLIKPPGHQPPDIIGILRDQGL